MPGLDEIAFAVGPTPRQTIGVASLSTGRITRRIATAKGPLTALAFAPDGSIYFAAGGSIWHADGAGAIQRITAGESLVAGAGALLVKVRENGKIRLVKVSPEGAIIQEIGSSDPVALDPLSPNGMDAGGRLLSALAPLDLWSSVPGVTGRSGRLERIAIDYQGDIYSMAWTRDGRIVALARKHYARIWKFSPQLRPER